MARYVLTALIMLATMLVTSFIWRTPAQSLSDMASSTGGVKAKVFCKWEFSHYESSAYEKEWFGLVGEAQDHICRTVAELRHAGISEKIVQRVKELYGIDRQVKWRKPDAILPSGLHESDQFMSRMHYKRTCYDARSRTFKPSKGRGVQLIEPLWGMLRDPFDIWCKSMRLRMPGWESAEGQSKQHIMPQGFAPYWYDAQSDNADNENSQWRSHGIPPWHSSYIVEHDDDLGLVYTKPRNIHLDIGSFYFSEWTPDGGKVNEAASGQWFYDTYHARGQEFDQFIAVEVAKLNDTVAYSQVPPDLVGRYNLMNIGMTMDSGDRLNTIDMIKRIIRPEDFFVMKLDIDNAPIEAPIIKSILEDDPSKGGASGLIDELMFEHHVNYYPMNMPWYWDKPATNETLLESYELFRNLRRKGIRAHSWP